MKMNKDYSLAEISLVYRKAKTNEEAPKIVSSSDAAKIFRSFLDKDSMNIREEAAVLFLNRANKVIGAYKVSSGGICSTVVDIRLILGVALKALSSSIVLAHTHPSGELKPSMADEHLTMKLKEAANYMDIKLLDHLILTTDTYFSFADEGII